MKKEKLDIAMMHCYRQLFAHSSPPADFDKLVEDAELNSFGQKVIPFMDYELSEDIFNDLMEKTISDFKIPKGYRDVFKRSILLGCSPKFKRNENLSQEDKTS